MWLRVLLALALAVAVYRLLVAPALGRGRGAAGPRRARFPCSTCRHCANEFDDGVICRYRGREVFKQEVHIRNCTDWARR